MLDFKVPLFVPADRPERFEKAGTCDADAIILDLEDAVAADAKDQARAALRTGFTEKPILLRINGENTQWYNEDIAAVSGLNLAAIVVPKAELGGSLGNLIANLSLPVFALIETARGLAQARQIAALPGIARLVFGSLDFSCDLGCAHTREALLSARSELVLASRLAEIPPPLDGVTTSIEDDALVASDASHSHELGFGGKLAIHPRQVGPIRSRFVSQTAEIEWATRVLASGEGVVTIDGAMVDEPVRIRARKILANVSMNRQ